VAADQFKDGKSVLVTDNRLTVDQARTHRELADRHRDERKARREIVSGVCNQPHARTIAPRENPKAVVLYFVEPTGPLGGVFAGDGKHGSIIPKPGRVRSQEKRKDLPVKLFKEQQMNIVLK
jgi:hypothetical protein